MALDAAPLNSRTPVPTLTFFPGGRGVLLSWYSVIGEYYQVQSLTNGVFQAIPGGPHQMGWAVR